MGVGSPFVVPLALGGEKDEGYGQLFQEALLRRHQKMGHGERGSPGKEVYH